MPMREQAPGAASSPAPLAARNCVFFHARVGTRLSTADIAR